MPKCLVTVRTGGFLVALVVLAGVAGCTGDTESQPPAASTPATTAPPSSAPARDYDATGLSLCHATDLTPLKTFGLTVAKTDPKPPPSAPGAACLFTLKTKDGHDGTLRVEASTPESADQAALLYQSTASVTDMVDEGPVAGLGEQAEGYSGQSTASGEKTTEYLVHARTGNVVAKTFLTVGGDDYASKESLAGPCREITADTLLLTTKN